MSSLVSTRSSKLFYNLVHFPVLHAKKDLEWIVCYIGWKLYSEIHPDSFVSGADLCIALLFLLIFRASIKQKVSKKMICPLQGSVLYKEHHLIYFMLDE